MHPYNITSVSTYGLLMMIVEIPRAILRRLTDLSANNRDDSVEYHPRMWAYSRNKRLIQNSGNLRYRKPNFISLIGWLMLGTVSQTMLYYLKQLTLLNHDLINFGNISI